MRTEATVPDSRGSALQELADQLGLSRSQIIDGALSLVLKAVLEIRQGRRLVTRDPTNAQAHCELTTRTLTMLEWAPSSRELQLPDAALVKVKALLDTPTKPGKRLDGAAKRHRR